MSGLALAPAVLPELGPPGWIALGVIGLGAAGYAGYKWYESRSQSTTNADDKAKSLSSADATTACPTCKGNPCAALAAGNPDSKYKGGAHEFMKGPTGDGLDSHHTPAAAASNLPRDFGPAIQMDPADHLQTASQSRQPGYLGYLAAQKDLVGSGNFLGAVGMDVADVHAKFGSKYDSALAQMSAYAACLKRTGVVK